MTVHGWYFEKQRNRFFCNSSVHVSQQAARLDALGLFTERRGYSSRSMGTIDSKQWSIWSPHSFSQQLARTRIPHDAVSGRASYGLLAIFYFHWQPHAIVNILSLNLFATSLMSMPVTDRVDNGRHHKFHRSL
jgi:hypothetical protein